MRTIIIANRKNTKPKKRKCKVCQSLFEVNPFKPFIGWCSVDCGYKYQQILKAKSEARKAKEERVKTNEQKEKLLTHSDYIQKLQKVFNAWIRERDKDLPCISCGTTKNVEYAAGHYFPTTYQYLRLEPDNVHKQCNKYCNLMKSGNLIEYREGLIKKIGVERLNELEASRHKRFEMSIPEIKEKITYYKNKMKNGK